MERPKQSFHRINLLNQEAITRLLGKCMKAFHEAGDTLHEMSLMSLMQAMGPLFGDNINFVMMEGVVEREPVDCTGQLGKVKVFVLRPYRRRVTQICRAFADPNEHLSSRHPFTCRAVVVAQESLFDIAGILREGDKVKIMGSLRRHHKYSVNDTLPKSLKPHNPTFKFEVLVSGMELVYEERMHKKIAPGSQNWPISPERESRGVL